MSFKMDTAVDADLFRACSQLGLAFDEADWLRDHLRVGAAERERFLNNEIENPKFIYRTQEPLVGYEARFQEVFEKLRDIKTEQVVVDLYEKKLEKLRARNNLISASLLGRDVEFYEASRQIYGRPLKQYFSYIALRVMNLCEIHEKNNAAATQRLRKVFGKINTSGVDISADILPTPVEDEEVIDSVADAVKIFRETLDTYGIKDWSVVVDDSGKRRNFVVISKNKQIVIPSERQLFSRSTATTHTHIRALAEHEIGVHVRRSYEAQKCNLRLLEMGLDGYLRGEEGVASYVQQQVEGAQEFYGFDRYLAACLAVGMDGEPRDFRAVFILMVDYYTLRLGGAKTKQNQEEAIPRPIQAAWDVCVRIFRGTTGQSAGCIYTKDIVYLEGNIGIWHLLSDKPHAFQYLFVGKYNPLNKRHVKTLQTLEIMPEW